MPVVPRLDDVMCSISSDSGLSFPASPYFLRLDCYFGNLRSVDLYHCQEKMQYQKMHQGYGTLHRLTEGMCAGSCLKCSCPDVSEDPC